MWILISIIVVVLVALAFKRGEVVQDKRSLDLLVSLRTYEPEIKAALDEFDQLVRSDWYISDRQYRLWRDKYRHLAEKCRLPPAKINSPDPFTNLVTSFADRFSNGRKLHIDPHNDNFISREVPAIQGVLNGKGIEHNRDQVNAIASDEDNTLLVAGAGTGKTTTILGKLAYLIDRVGVGSEEILLLSFTGRAVNELTERVARKFPDKKLKAWTFHSFGLSILGKVLGRKPDLAFENSVERQTWLDQQFDLQLKEPAYLHRAIEYFAYYLKPVILKPGFSSLDEYYKYSRTEQNLTLQKELLKSQQEVMIANFLYMNGVKYQYENPYKFQTADKDYKQYKPDFYLPDYEIYIEHFGVDREGNTHFTENSFQNAAQTRKYQADIAWKRSLHAQHKTTLVKTFSYEFTERTWKEKLAEQLRAHAVKLVPRDLGEILDSLRKNGSVKEITHLFSTFLDLAKSNGYDLEQLQRIVQSRNNHREGAFLEIFAPLYSAYQQYLTQRGAIDFHDMLLTAAQFVTEGRYSASFKYIIIDEFQDFSVSKCLLVKALCDQNPNTKLFCVGDDWQSIFRFTGSDISLM